MRAFHVVAEMGCPKEGFITVGMGAAKDPLIVMGSDVLCKACGTVEGFSAVFNGTEVVFEIGWVL